MLSRVLYALFSGGGPAVLFPAQAMTTTALTNAQKTYIFLRNADAVTRASITGSIAERYGISNSEVFDEVTATGAEHLLDYLTGSVRSATSALMQRSGLA
jgi:hypothetical protein